MHQTRRNQIAQWSKKARQTNALGSRALHAPVEADPEAADDNEEAVGGVESSIPLNGGGGRGWKDAGRGGGTGTERGGLGASKLETAGGSTERTASAPLHGRKNHHDHTKKKKGRGHSARDDEYDDGADDAEEEDGDAEEGDVGAEDDNDAESEDGSYSQFRLDEERGRDKKKEKPINK